ncbi:MAG: YlxR family protein, partial [Actinomycetota bacterium]|nr:YlxR family protein [Actinomycetota bacterium]
MRCAITDDGRAVVSRTAAGRGAWLCRTPTDCLGAALRRRAFQRAWRRDVDPAVLAELAEQLARIHDPVGPLAAVGRDDEAAS